MKEGSSAIGSITIILKVCFERNVIHAAQIIDTKVYR